MRGTAMVPISVDVDAASPRAAEQAAKAQPGNEGAITLKIKKVRS
jgi:hypothetical protein